MFSHLPSAKYIFWCGLPRRQQATLSPTRSHACPPLWIITTSLATETRCWLSLDHRYIQARPWAKQILGPEDRRGKSQALPYTRLRPAPWDLVDWLFGLSCSRDHASRTEAWWCLRAPKHCEHSTPRWLKRRSRHRVCRRSSEGQAHCRLRPYQLRRRRCCPGEPEAWLTRYMACPPTHPAAAASSYLENSPAGRGSQEDGGVQCTPGCRNPERECHCHWCDERPRCLHSRARVRCCLWRTARVKYRRSVRLGEGQEWSVRDVARGTRAAKGWRAQVRRASCGEASWEISWETLIVGDAWCELLYRTGAEGWAGYAVFLSACQILRAFK